MKSFISLNFHCKNGTQSCVRCLWPANISQSVKGDPKTHHNRSYRIYTVFDYHWPWNVKVNVHQLYKYNMSNIWMGSNFWNNLSSKFLWTYLPWFLQQFPWMLVAPIPGRWWVKQEMQHAGSQIASDHDTDNNGLLVSFLLTSCSPLWCHQIMFLLSDS